MSSPDATRAELAEYLRLHPDATAPEALGACLADPDRWLADLVEALDADDPAGRFRELADPTDDGDTTEQ